MSTIIHLVRHGRVPDYKTDQSLNVLGQEEALAAGQTLAAAVQPGETVRFFSSPSRRARETAALLRQGLQQGLGQHDAIMIQPITAVDDLLQDVKFYLDGANYAPITPLLDIARWRLQENPSAEVEAFAAYQYAFWAEADPVGYWLTQPSPVVESPEAVLRRTQTFLAERLAEKVEDSQARRDVCVTHSPLLRIFLQTVFNREFGPPPFSGMLTIAAGRVQYQNHMADFLLP